jgi:hypothetical protein
MSHDAEIIFTIEDAPEGGYVARTLPKIIRLHFVREEDPFSCFEEWASEADTEGFASL